MFLVVVVSFAGFEERGMGGGRGGMVCIAGYSGTPLIRTPMDSKSVHISEVSVHARTVLGEGKGVLRREVSLERCP